MNKKAFECNSCSYTIFVDERKTAKEHWCPSCRSTMYAAEIETPPECAEYTCDECGAEFCVPAAAIAPYKCPRCNFTFPFNPDRKVKHRL